MNNSNFMLVSMGFGMLLVVLLKIQLPLYLSVGITIFVTLIAIYDFYSVLIEIEKSGYKYLDYAHSIFNYVFNIIRSFILPASVPLAIFVTYLIMNNSSLEQIDNLEQNLTSLSLGVLLMSIGFKRH